MYNSRKKVDTDMTLELTDVWYCSNDNCNIWMRDNFSFSIAPICISCQSEMVKQTKELGVVENNSPITTEKI